MVPMYMIQSISLKVRIFLIQGINCCKTSVLTLSSPSGDESRFFSSCSGVGSASPHMSFPKTYMK